MNISDGEGDLDDINSVAVGSINCDNPHSNRVDSIFVAPAYANDTSGQVKRTTTESTLLSRQLFNRRSRVVNTNDDVANDKEHLIQHNSVQAQGHVRRHSFPSDFMPSIVNGSVNHTRGNLQSKGHTSDLLESSPASCNNCCDEADEHNEGTPLVGNKTNRIYYRRWYVLVIFCLASLLQSLGWGTFGPISQSAKAVFGWNNGNIALLALWMNLAYIIFAVPVSLMLEKKGLRYSMIVSMILQAAGFGLRCVSFKPITVTWFMNIGQILIGAGSIIPYSAVSLFSSVWFPLHQRTSATSVTSATGYLGMAVAFIIGPVVVPEPDMTTNMTDILLPNSSYSMNGNDSCTSVMRDAISRLMYYEAGVAGLILLLVLIYFPAKPPTPPTVSATIERLELWNGTKNLLRSKQFVMVLLANSMGTGIYGTLSTIIDIDLQPLGVTQVTAGYMGFYSTIGGCICGFLLARLSDKFPRRIRGTLFLMFVLMLGLLIWFLLMTAKYIPSSTGTLYASVVASGVLMFASTPLFYELACEASYPTGEAVSALALTCVNNAVGSIFLLIFMVPHIGVVWINWLIAVSVAFACAVLAVTRVKYRRTNIDLEYNIQDPELIT